MGAPEFADVVEAAYTDILNGKHVATYAYTLITKDGRRIDTMLNTKLVEYDEGYAILGTAVDITQKKLEKAALLEAQDKLHKAEKLTAIGQFASGIAHQLRNPLGVINNAAHY